MGTRSVITTSRMIGGIFNKNGYITSEELIKFGDAIWEELYKEYGVKPIFERR